MLHGFWPENASKLLKMYVIMIVICLDTQKYLGCYENTGEHSRFTFFIMFFLISFLISKIMPTVILFTCNFARPRRRIGSLGNA